MRANLNERDGGCVRGKRIRSVGQAARLLLFALILPIASQAVGDERVHSIPWQASLQRTAASDDASRPAGGGGGGGDILVFDIVDSMVEESRQEATRSGPAGGGGGADILVFDIVDSVVDSDGQVEAYKVLLEVDGELGLATVWVDTTAKFGVMLRYSF